MVVGKHGAAQDQHKDGRSCHDQQYQLEDLYIKLLLQGLRGIRNDRFRCRSRRTGAVCGVLGSGQGLAGGIAVTQGSQSFGQGFAAHGYQAVVGFALDLLIVHGVGQPLGQQVRRAVQGRGVLIVHSPTAGGPHAVHVQKQLHAGILQHGLVDDVAEVVGRGIHRAEVEYDELLGAGVIHHIGA